MIDRTGDVDRVDDVRVAGRETSAQRLPECGPTGEQPRDRKRWGEVRGVMVLHGASGTSRQRRLFLGRSLRPLAATSAAPRTARVA
ncbi:hypothetical protein ACOSYY_16475 [Nitrospira sp. BLG_2]